MAKTFTTSTFLYTRDEDGQFYIPSLAYALKVGDENRHFDCDSSNYNFPDGIFEGDKTVDIMQHIDRDGESEFIPHSDLREAIIAMNEASEHGAPNSYVVMGVKTGESICLTFFWVE